VLVQVVYSAAVMLALAPDRLDVGRGALAHVLHQVVVRVKGLTADSACRMDEEPFQRAMVN